MGWWGGTGMQESELRLTLRRAAWTMRPGLRAAVTGAGSDAESGRHGVPFGLCHWRGREEPEGLLLMWQADAGAGGGAVVLGKRSKHSALKPQRESSRNQSRTAPLRRPYNTGWPEEAGRVLAWALTPARAHLHSDTGRGEAASWSKYSSRSSLTHTEKPENVLMTHGGNNRPRAEGRPAARCPGPHVHGPSTLGTEGLPLQSPTVRTESLEVTEGEMLPHVFTRAVGMHRWLLIY